MYHRNGKFKSSRSKDPHDRTVPYFPLMTLHSHWSGFDITFENPEKKYRASVLIREYAIYDVKERKYVYWDTKKKEYNYILSDKPIKDNRSSYLIYYINGFTIQEGQMTRIEWVDMMPEVYGKVLAEAIRVHENVKEEAESDICERECFLADFREMFREGSLDEDGRIYMEVLMEKIEDDREKANTAMQMTKICEARLVELLEDHPELNE